MEEEYRVAGPLGRRQDLEGLTDLFLVSLAVGGLYYVPRAFLGVSDSGALLCVLVLVGFAQYVFGFLVSGTTQSWDDINMTNNITTND